MIENLLDAGPIMRIVRVGYAPFEGDEPGAVIVQTAGPAAILAAARVE